VNERLPLSTLLSQALVAFTMEFDNEAEREVTAAGWGRRFLVSQVMWANLMRFVDDAGVFIGEIPDRAGFPGTPVKTGWIHGCLVGMERWGYVTIGPDPADRRAKPPRAALLVTPTAAGRKARGVWLPLAGVIEQRWRARFGDDVVDQLRLAVVALLDQVEPMLPHHLPIVVYSDGMRTAAPHLESWTTTAGAGARESPRDLSALLAPLLLLLAVDFERESTLSLAIGANALRVSDDGTPVRDLPRRAGVSKEAISASLTFLDRRGFASVETDPNASRTKVVRLTQKGRAARDSIGPLLAVVEARWQARFGTDAMEQLHDSLETILGHPRLPDALEPPPTGWRANKPYARQTAALVADPRAGLPHFPMATHRGGWPDGS
jgi:DNA-binding MarR family transcriptional regulator